LMDASRPTRVEYRGAATIASSQLRLAISFQISAMAEATEIGWSGNVALDGMLALLAGNMVDTMGRQNFERMAQSLQRNLGVEQATPVEASHSESSSHLDFDI